MTNKRDCENCVYAKPYGGENDNRCAAWECEFIDRKEAIEAYKARRDIDLVRSIPEAEEVTKAINKAMQNLIEYVEESNTDPFQIPTWLYGFPATPVEEYEWTWTDEATYGHPYGAYVCVCGNVMPHKTPYCPSCGRKIKV